MLGLKIRGKMMVFQLHGQMYHVIRSMSAEVGALSSVLHVKTTIVGYHVLSCGGGGLTWRHRCYSTWEW